MMTLSFFFKFIKHSLMLTKNKNQDNILSEIEILIDCNKKHMRHPN